MPGRLYDAHRIHGARAGDLSCAADGSDRTTEPSGAWDAPAAAAAPQFTIRNLGTLGGDTSAANSINEQGEVVGYSDLSAGVQHASSGGMAKDSGASAPSAVPTAGRVGSTTAAKSSASARSSPVPPLPARFSGARREGCGAWARWAE